MRILSYAQNLEDVVLNRAFADRRDGFYVDVGAGDPIEDSVTKFFYDRGWHGINIEPLPNLSEALVADRPRDINLPVGLSNREGTLSFYEVPDCQGISTFSREQAEEHHRSTGFAIVERLIPVTTLARVCELNDVPTIDFLKVDVESCEREVLEGADWERYRPRVVVVEATRPLTTIPCYDTWEPLLLSADYLFAFFDGLNRYYVRAEDRELMPLLSAPINHYADYERFQHHHRVQELEHQVQELRLSIEELQEQREGPYVALEETRAVLRDTQAHLTKASEELAATRRELEATRAALEGAGADLAETRGRLGSTQAELDVARARLEIFEGWGPLMIGTGRRLRRLSARFPLPALMLRRAILGSPARGPAAR